MRLFIILLLFTSVFADRYEHHTERHINKEISHLKLSKAQELKVKNILREFTKELKEFSEFKKEIEEKRERLFAKEKLDVKALENLNTVIDAKRHEIENRLLLKMHKELSPKQRERFIYYFDDWKVE